MGEAPLCADTSAIASATEEGFATEEAEPKTQRA
jgi:hypothetical protein